MWDLQDLSFCASLVPIVEKCSLRILAIDLLLQYRTPSASMQEMGVLSLRDVMSFRVFHNALGLDLFSVISLE